MRSFFSGKRVALMGILSCLSFLLYYFVNIPLPFIFPEFLEINIANVPALIGGFSLGPVAGCIIVAVRILLKLPFSSSHCIGELCDFILGIAIVLPSSLIYSKHRTRKHAFLGLALGSVLLVISALVVNRTFLIKAYIWIYFNGNENILIGMVSGLYNNITMDNFYKYYLWLAVLPFNLLCSAINSIITALCYKPLSRMFSKFMVAKPKNNNDKTLTENIETLSIDNAESKESDTNKNNEEQKNEDNI